jgi:hypothetical protein
MLLLFVWCMNTHLKTVGEVILAIGGPKVVGEITGKRTVIVACWKYRKRFPARTYPALQSALQERGFSAPLELWGIQ